jgi:hypothetical protein
MKDSSVPDMYDKIDSESTGLGKLLSKIPGFNGYIEKGRRREADQILRETIASRLEESRLKLAGVHQELSRDIIKAIDYAEPLGRADTRLMGLIGKIKDAPEGYAGFFDAVKVKEEELAQVYAFDEAMLTFSEEIGADVDALEKSVLDEGDIDFAIRELDNTLRDANETYNSRQEILSGVS